MIIRPGDEVRAAERIVRLLGRYAERFDPPSRAEFYGSIADRVKRMHVAEHAFIHADKQPSRKKPPQRPPARTLADAALDLSPLPNGVTAWQRTNARLGAIA